MKIRIPVKTILLAAGAGFAIATVTTASAAPMAPAVTAPLVNGTGGCLTFDGLHGPCAKAGEWQVTPGTGRLVNANGKCLLASKALGPIVGKCSRRGHRWHMTNDMIRPANAPRHCLVIDPVNLRNPAVSLVPCKDARASWRSWYWKVSA